MKQAATLFLPILLAFSGSSFCDTKPEQISPSKNLSADSLYQLLSAEMALDREQPEVAIANYIASARETQDPLIAARATQIALSGSTLEAALEPAMIWAKVDPNNLEAQITTAALLIRLDKVEKSVPYLLKTEQINAHDAFQYFLILFRQLQKEEDSKRVVHALQLLSKEETKEISAHMALAEIYLYKGEEKKAFDISSKAIKINPKSTIAVQLYAESLFRTKGKDEAKNYLDKTVVQFPNETLLRQYYAQFLLDNGFKDKAREEIESIITKNELKPEELLQFARLSMQAQWYDLAEKVLFRTRAIPASKDLSHYFLARLAEMQNKEEVAIEWFRQVLTGPFHVLSQVRAALLLTEKKHYDDALQILSRTNAGDDNDKKQILLTTVEVYNKSKRYTEAYSLLDENMKSLSDDVELLYARSFVADKLNKPDLAENDLKTILQLHPNHLEALNALGFMLATKTKRFDEAKQYLNQALSISPNNASVLDSLGWLYYKQGEYQKSLETLQRAAEIMPDGEIAAHLGEVLWKLKDFEGAKRVWSSGLEKEPKDENILNAMKRLMGKN